MGFKNYSFDPTMSPPGKSVVASVFYADYDYWKELAEDGEKYEAEKERIAHRVVEELEKRFPEAAGKVEVTDVATPVTFTRYTGVWKGAYMSWISTPKSGNIILPKRLTGLRDFYMAGLWTHGSAGLPGAAVTGVTERYASNPPSLSSSRTRPAMAPIIRGVIIGKKLTMKTWCSSRAKSRCSFERGSAQGRP